jgi:hypothetical protein
MGDLLLLSDLFAATIQRANRVPNWGPKKSPENLANRDPSGDLGRVMTVRNRPVRNNQRKEA